MPRKPPPSPAPLKRLDRADTLLSRTERILREAIAQGTFTGDRLPPASELAEQLGVSRETVRLAQDSLQREGLLVKYRRRGTLIQPLAMSLKRDASRSTLLGYLQAQYSARNQEEEEVTRATSGLMLQGAMEAAAKAGFQLVAHQSSHTDLDRAITKLTRESTLRGLVFASTGEEKAVRRVLALGLPVVLLDHELNIPDAVSVRDDSRQGAALAVAYLAGKGHRHIAHASWRFEDLNVWRRTGYREGLRRARLPRRRIWELPAEITPAGAEALAGKLLSLSPRPTALITFNNTLARLLIDSLRQHSVRVPEDLSILGMGGEAVSGLSCVQADWFEMGRCAVDVLLDQIAHPKKARDASRHFPYRIHASRTVAAPPT